MKNFKSKQRQKIFKCKFCPLQSNKKSNVTVHEGLHNQQHRRRLPFKCESCDLSFSIVQAKKQHEMVHQIGYPFEVIDCPYYEDESEESESEESESEEYESEEDEFVEKRKPVKQKSNGRRRSHRLVKRTATGPREQIPLVQADEEEEMEVENDELQIGQQQNKEVDKFGLPIEFIPGSRKRSDQLKEMASQFGLKSLGLMDEVEYYCITFDKANAKVPGYNQNTMIEIKIGLINNSIGAIVQMKNGVRQNGNFQFRWPIPDFEHFIWAIRGLCHETFVPLNKERMHSNDAVADVEEPPDEEENGEGTSNAGGGGTNGQPETSFSIMDGHPQLRLEEMAGHLGLQIRRETNQLIMGYPNQMHRLLIKETNATIQLVEFHNGGKQRGKNKKEWPKSTGRSHFRYALMGIAVELFGVDK